MQLKSLFSIIICILLFTSCSVNSHDEKVGQEIMTMIKGNGNIGFVTEKFENKKDSSVKYIELRIDSSQVLNKNGLTKPILASFCASYLYDNIEQSKIQDNDGIHILYSDDVLGTLNKPYYFKMSQLQKINMISNILYDFTQSFSYGNSTSDYFASNSDSLEIITLKQNIQKLDSIGLKDQTPTYRFHSTYPRNHKYQDKFLIVWVYKLPNNQTLAIDFVTEKEIRDNIIYNFDVRI